MQVTYTAFVAPTNDPGNIWIGPIEVKAKDNIADLRQRAIAACIEDWAGIWNDDEFHCYGFAQGHVKIIDWEDFEP